MTPAYSQALSASNIHPEVYAYVTGTAPTTTIAWQNTSSGATYTSAASALGAGGQSTR
jgi:hypothetical protein